MATVTLNSGLTVDLSMAELVELDSILRNYKVDLPKSEPTPRPAPPKAEPKNDSGDIEILTCKTCGEHFERATGIRGRKPTQCSACKGAEGDSQPDSEPEPTPEPAPKNNGGYRRGYRRGNYVETPLDELSDEEGSASDKQLDRIRVQLNARKLSNSKRKEILAQVDSGKLSIRGAARIYRWLKTQESR